MTDMLETNRALRSIADSLKSIEALIERQAEALDYISKTVYKTELGGNYYIKISDADY